MFDNLEHDETKLMDSSAVTEYQVCPRKYFYRYVLGYAPIKKPIYFAWGTSVHLFREKVETLYLANKDEDLQKIVAEGIQYALEFANKEFPLANILPKFDWMTPARLLRALLVSAQWWINEKQKGAIKVIAIELPWKVIIKNPHEETEFIIAGRFDNVIEWSRKVWGRDFKTTTEFGGYYINTLSPNDQFTRYTYAQNKLAGWNEEDPNDLPQVGGQLIEVLFGNKTTEPKIEVFPTQRTRSELLTWKKEQIQIHRLMNVNRKDDIWPMNTKSCKFCEYRKVCEGSNETSQMNTLKHNYKIEKWDPTKGSKDS